MNRLHTGVLLTLVVVLAGCSAPAAPDNGMADGDRYQPTQSIAVDATDGLNETEREAVVGRAMARIEVLRELEFEKSVEVRVITRDEYRDQQSGSNETHVRWNNQVWEGLFIVGEDRDIDDVFNQTLGSSIAGYYSPSDDEIVIVSDSETPTIDRGTLVHELVHALQDQRFGLEDGAKTQDRQLARSGLIEGEANGIEERYQDRCQGSWDCVDLSSGGGPGDVDRGVYLVILTPYLVGPSFVENLRSDGGWPAVDDAYENYPASSEQVIHPARYPEDSPVNVTIPDRSSSAWDRFDHDPVADTVGQASIHATFITNSIQTGGVDTYGYRHPAAEGWAGDALVPYHADDGYGYVWETAWDTRADAEQFHEAYLDLLEAHGATKQGEESYAVPESDAFGDAFRVTLDGKRVRVVNAPAVPTLSAVHAG